jgi:peptide methionine sulfoxide reductase MsrB
MHSSVKQWAEGWPTFLDYKCDLSLKLTTHPQLMWSRLRVFSLQADSLEGHVWEKCEEAREIKRDDVNRIQLNWLGYTIELL